MLSKSTFRYIDQSFVVSNTLWLVPFYWNTENHQFCLEIPNKHYLFSLIVLIYYSCDCLYSSFVVHEMIGSLNSSNFEITMQVSIHWFTRSVTLFCQFFLWGNSREIAHYYNKLLQIHQQFASKLLKTRQYNTKTNSSQCQRSSW